MTSLGLRVCTHVLFGIQLGDTRVLECIQRNTTRVCPTLRHLSYHDRLVALNLPSLMYRRQRMDMIMNYKILHGLDRIPFSNLFSYHHTVSRSNSYKSLLAKKP